MTARYVQPPFSPWVERCAPLIPSGGSVLDVACGTGRHVTFLARAGYRVTAIDRDISRFVYGEAIEAIKTDLEGGNAWPLSGRMFDAVVVTNYLHRPLFPILIDSVNPGGALIYETFAHGNEKLGRPGNPDFLLRGGELLEAVAGKLSVVIYEAGRIDDPKPAIVQRIAAVRTETVAPAIPQRI